jgi:excisionase family DNA binding protein
VASLPDGASVQLSVGGLHEWLADEEGNAAGLAAQMPVQIDLTVEEVAAALHRKPSTVRSWCAARRIEGAYRLRGREWRIPLAALRTFQANQLIGK